MQKLIVIICLISFLNLKAQQSDALYFMYRVPESSFLNPARQFPCQFYMGVPLLASLQFNYSNTAFSLKSMSDIVGEAATLNTDKIISHTHLLDHISTEIHYTLFSFGFRKFSYYFSFALTEKDEFYLSLPKDLTGMINLNGSYLDKGKPINLDRLGVNFFHYREYAFAGSKQINEDLSLGISAKILFGKLNVNTQTSDIKINTDPTNWDINVQSNTKINTSAPINIQTANNGTIENIGYDQSASITDLIFNRKNPGLSYDGGFFYQYDDNFTFSGSYNDLGFIWWRSYLNNLNYKGSYTYKGQNFSAANTNIIPVNQLIDSSVANIIPSLSKRKYITFLPLKLYLGTEYKINNFFRLGLLGRVEVYQYRFDPSVILSLNTNLTRFLTATVTYSYNDYTLRNIGFGFTFQTRNIQFYALSDNVAAFYWLESARNVNLRFGMNLFFGCRTKRKTSMKCAGCYWYEMMEEKRNRISRDE